MMPYVILNAAMTLRVHELRKQCDGIMVGIGTVLADDPRLTVHKIDAKKTDNPVRVVVDSRLQTPQDARITNDDARTIIACANEYKDEIKSSEKYNDFRKKGVSIFWSGDKRVDLKSLMIYLHEEGIEKLMLEGGSTLNFSMIKAGLIDEISICVAPMIAGGVNSKTFFDGEGFDTMDEAVRLELLDSYNLDKDLILKYKVLK